MSNALPPNDLPPLGYTECPIRPLRAEPVARVDEGVPLEGAPVVMVRV